MRNFIDLKEKQFGKLTVIERSATPAHLKNQNCKYWKCICKCGNNRIVKTSELINGDVQQCGSRCGKNLINKKIGKLTVKEVDEIKSSNKYTYYICDCECGKQKAIRADHLENEKINSCGCLRQKYHPQETSALTIWRSSYKDLEFHIFLAYSQMNCHYCGIPPNKTINSHISYLNNNSTEAKRIGFFNYNGIDRINSNLGHLKNNIVPCCYYCNSAKLNRTYDDFFIWINKIYNYIKYFGPKINYNKNIELNSHTLSVAKHIWRNLYSDLPIDVFLQLSQNNCYYCNCQPMNAYFHSYVKNKLNKTPFTFIYNGIDRVDSNQNHTIDNSVPCCVYCNKAKLDRSINDFYQWIIKLYININNKNLQSTNVNNFIETYTNLTKNYNILFPLKPPVLNGENSYLTDNSDDISISKDQHQ